MLGGDMTRRGLTWTSLISDLSRIFTPISLSPASCNFKGKKKRLCFIWVHHQHSLSDTECSNSPGLIECQSSISAAPVCGRWQSSWTEEWLCSSRPSGSWVPAAELESSTAASSSRPGRATQSCYCVWLKKKGEFKWALFVWRLVF